MCAPGNLCNTRKVGNVTDVCNRAGIDFEITRREPRARSCDRRGKACTRATGELAGTRVMALASTSDIKLDSKTPTGYRRRGDVATATKKRPLKCDTTETIEPAAKRKRLGQWRWPRVVRKESKIPRAGKGLFVEAEGPLWEIQDEQTEEIDKQIGNMPVNPDDPVPRKKIIPKDTAVAKLIPSNTVRWTECLRCADKKKEWNDRHEQMLTDIMTKLVDETLAVDGFEDDKKAVDNLIIEKAKSFIDKQSIDRWAIKKGWTKQEHEKALERMKKVRSLVMNSFCCTTCDKSIPKNRRLPFRNNITWSADDEHNESVTEVMDVFYREEGKEAYGLKPKIPKRNLLWQSANEASEKGQANAIWVEEKKTKESKNQPRVVGMLLVLTRDVKQGEEIVVESYGENYEADYPRLGSDAYGIAVDNQMAIWRDGQFRETVKIRNKRCSYEKAALARLKKIMQEDCKVRNVASAKVNEAMEDLTRAAHPEIMQP